MIFVLVLILILLEVGYWLMEQILLQQMTLIVLILILLEVGYW